VNDFDCKCVNSEYNDKSNNINNELCLKWWCLACNNTTMSYGTKRFGFYIQAISKQEYSSNDAIMNKRSLNIFTSLQRNTL